MNDMFAPYLLKVFLRQGFLKNRSRLPMLTFLNILERLIPRVFFLKKMTLTGEETRSRTALIRRY